MQYGIDTDQARRKLTMQLGTHKENQKMQFQTLEKKTKAKKATQLDSCQAKFPPKVQQSKFVLPLFIECRILDLAIAALTQYSVAVYIEGNGWTGKLFSAFSSNLGIESFR